MMYGFAANQPDASQLCDLVKDDCTHLQHGNPAVKSGGMTRSPCSQKQRSLVSKRLVDDSRSISSIFFVRRGVDFD
jgi:hypothetical protein